MPLPSEPQYSAPMPRTEDFLKTPTIHMLPHLQTLSHHQSTNHHKQEREALEKHLTEEVESDLGLALWVVENLTELAIIHVQETHTTQNEGTNLLLYLALKHPEARSRFLENHLQNKYEKIDSESWFVTRFKAVQQIQKTAQKIETTLFPEHLWNKDGYERFFSRLPEKVQWQFHYEIRMFKKNKNRGLITNAENIALLQGIFLGIKSACYLFQGHSQREKEILEILVKSAKKELLLTSKTRNGYVVFCPEAVMKTAKKHPTIFHNYHHPTDFQKKWENKQPHYNSAQNSLEDGLLFGYPPDAVQAFSQNELQEKLGPDHKYGSSNIYGNPWVYYAPPTPSDLKHETRFKAAYENSGILKIGQPKQFQTN